MKHNMLSAKIMKIRRKRLTNVLRRGLRGGNPVSSQNLSRKMHKIRSKVFQVSRSRKKQAAKNF